MPVDTGSKEGMLLFEPTSRLFDMLCFMSQCRKSSYKVMVSNTGKTAHVLKKGEELGSAYKVNRVNLPGQTHTFKVWLPLSQMKY